MAKRISLILTALFLVTLPLSSCEKAPPPFECVDPLGCVDIAPGEPVKLAVLQALSGAAAALGRAQLRAIKLAVEERGRILGHPIELQTEDSKCTPEGGTLAALKVVADPRILGILGTSCSASGITASKVMTRSGLAMISGANSAPSLTSRAGKRGKDAQSGYFRTMPNNFEMSEALAGMIFREMAITRAATVNDGDAYTRGLTDFFGAAFEKIGGEIVLDARVDKGDRDMRPLLEGVKESGAELLFLSLFHPEGDYLVLQAKETPGLEKLVLVATTAMLTDDFVKEIGEKGVGLYIIGPFLPETPAHEELLSKFNIRYGGSPTHGTTYPRAYEAANLLVEAIEKTAIQEKDGTLHIGRQALRETLYATEDFEGVTGRLSCDEFGDCGKAQYTIFRIDDPEAGIEGAKANVIYTFSDGRLQPSN